MRSTWLWTLVLALLAAPLCAQPYAYIETLDKTLSIIDTSSRELICTFGVGRGASAIAVSPDGATVYLTSIDPNELRAVDVVNHRVRATATLGDYPNGVAVSPDGTRIYVAEYAQDARLRVIDASSFAVVDVVQVYFDGFTSVGTAVAVHPDGHEVYVATTGLAIVDAQSHTYIETIPTWGQPRSVAVGPEGLEAYVVGAYSGRHLLEVVDLVSRTVLAEVEINRSPEGVAVSPDGRRVYVTSGYENSVYVIDATSYTVLTTVPVGTYPTGVGVTPDGAHVYVTNSFEHSVSVIDTASHQVIATIAAGRSPTADGLFIGPASAPGPQNCGCEAGPYTLCLDDSALDRRFRVTLDYATELGGGYAGQAMATSLRPLGINKGGILSFFHPSNPEVLVKVLNGCGDNGHFWVFLGAATTAGFELNVEDTMTGVTASYGNDDLTTAQPITDTFAFECEP